MTLARYLMGVGLAAASVLPLLAGSWRLRNRLLPTWRGAPARLAEVVLVLASLVVVSELLGLLGVLSLAPVVCGCALAGGLLWLAGRRESVGGTRGAAPPRPAELVPGVVALGAGTMVVAAWSTRLLPALDHGMTGADTLWYHLPQAARFVQDHSITHVQFFETGAGTAFYPATSGLFHALGMVWLGNDFASPFLNMGWLGVALLAAWCLGRPYGLGAVSLVGVSLVLATPIMVETQPGGAYNDIVGIALFLAAAALIVNGGPTGAPGVLAAVAAAPALGTKLSLAVPLAALAVGTVAITPSGRRLWAAGVWLGAILIFGGLWYGRNLVAFGNPIPALKLDVGPLSLPSPPLTKLTFSLVHYFGTPGVWRGTFFPGLQEAFGPAWWAMLALAVAGMGGALAAGRGRAERMLGAVAIVSAVTFLVTPQGLGTDADPLFFKFNLRYPAPALVLGLCLLPLLPVLASRARQWLVVGAEMGVLLATQLDPAIWPTGLREGRFAEAPSGATAAGALAIGAAVLLAAGLVAVLPRARERTAPGRGVPQVAVGVAAVAVALVVAGRLVERDYLRARYTDYEPLREVSRWARDVHDSRIAIVGFFVQYPLYGLDLSNRVDYIARHGPHGAFTPIRGCRAWREALNAGRYRYVVTTPFNYPGNLRRDEPPEARWTGSDPAAHQILREHRVVTVFRLDRRLDPGGCVANAR